MIRLSIFEHLIRERFHACIYKRETERKWEGKKISYVIEVSPKWCITQLQCVSRRLHICRNAPSFKKPCCFFRFLPFLFGQRRWSTTLHPSVTLFLLFSFYLVDFFNPSLWFFFFVDFFLTPTIDFSFVIDSSSYASYSSSFFSLFYPLPLPFLDSS